MSAATSALLGKREVRICVTDDGLGGLSILSEIERRLRDESARVGGALRAYEHRADLFEHVVVSA